MIETDFMIKERAPFALNCFRAGDSVTIPRPNFERIFTDIYSVKPRNF